MVMAAAPDADEYDDPFESPNDYVLQKTVPGVLGLHMVLRDLWAAFEKTGTQFERNKIRDAILRAGEVARSSDPQDDFTTRRTWNSEDGTFAFYGGQKGAKGLADLITEYLIEVGYGVNECISDDE